VAHVDGTVGISGADLNINNTSIATGQTVSVTGFTLANGN
jgi:primosomal replication protein N